MSPHWKKVCTLSLDELEALRVCMFPPKCLSVVQQGLTGAASDIFCNFPKPTIMLTSCSDWPSMRRSSSLSFHSKHNYVRLCCVYKWVQRYEWLWGKCLRCYRHFEWLLHLAPLYGGRLFGPPMNVAIRNSYKHRHGQTTRCTKQFVSGIPYLELSRDCTCVNPIIDWKPIHSVFLATKQPWPWIQIRHYKKQQMDLYQLLTTGKCPSIPL